MQAYETLDQDIEDFNIYLLEYEGQPDHYKSDSDDNNEDEHIPITQYLQTNIYLHRILDKDIYTAPHTDTSTEQFILENQYTRIYQGELWNTGIIQISTIGKCQMEAYLRENPYTKVRWISRSAEIRFKGSNIQTSIDMIKMKNQLDMITYHILDTSTPFLLYLYDTVAERWCRARNEVIDKSEDALLILVAAHRTRNSPDTLSHEGLSNLAEPSYVLIGRSHLGNTRTPAPRQQILGPKMSSISSLTHQTKLNQD